MPFYLKKGDLVSANVDVIVNASNVNPVFRKSHDKTLELPFW